MSAPRGTRTATRNETRASASLSSTASRATSCRRSALPTTSGERRKSSMSTSPCRRCDAMARRSERRSTSSSAARSFRRISASDGLAASSSTAATSPCARCTRCRRPRSSASSRVPLTRARCRPPSRLPRVVARSRPGRSMRRSCSLQGGRWGQVLGAGGCYIVRMGEAAKRRATYEDVLAAAGESRRRDHRRRPHHPAASRFTACTGVLCAGRRALRALPARQGRPGWLDPARRTGAPSPGGHPRPGPGRLETGTDAGAPRRTGFPAGSGLDLRSAVTRRRPPSIGPTSCRSTRAKGSATRGWSTPARRPSKCFVSKDRTGFSSGHGAAMAASGPSRSMRSSWSSGCSGRGEGNRGASC